MAKTKGRGGTYRRWGGGPKPFLGRGFMVCFPSPEFCTPLCFSLRLIKIPKASCRMGDPEVTR